jgi:prefoldin subunit 5
VMDPDDVEAQVERLADDVEEFEAELDRIEDLAERLDSLSEDLPGGRDE